MKRLVVAITATSLIAGAAGFAAVAQAASGSSTKTTTPVAAAKPAAASTAETAQSRGAAAYTPPKIKWAPCYAPDPDEPVDPYAPDCGFLTVPLSYGKPTGTKIKLAVSRVKHQVSADKYQGVMITNPGGPGGSGLGLSVLGQYVPNGAGDAYDWFGFDPRGVGSSVPSLTCDGNYFKAPRPAYVPTTQKLEDTWLKKSKDYAKKCDKAGGKLLDYVKTTDTVYDVETLRKALKVDQINYYGFSYGTYLGQVYATKYPTHLRRAVFDGVVDPTRVWYKANLDQDHAFDKSIKVFFAWVATNDATYGLGDTEAKVEKAYYASLKTLTKTPAGKKLGGSEWNDVFVSAGYYVYGWEDVASAFSAYVNDGDYKPALALYQGANPTGKGADNGFAMYLATQCTDAKWSKSWYKWRMDAWTTYGQAPFITWNNTWFNTPCITWGAKSNNPVTVDGTKAPGFLLINETLDAATPYSGALKMRSLFPKSVLIEGVGGSTHAGSLSGVACTDDKIAAYLTDGTLPTRVAGNQSDVQCDPVPAPDPTAPEALAKKASGTSLSRASLAKLIGTR